MNIQDFVFFDSNSDSDESNILNVANGCKNMMLQYNRISGEGVCYIEGRTDIVDGTWIELPMIAIDELDTYIGTTADYSEIYSIPIEGIRQIKATKDEGLVVKLYGLLTGERS